MTLIHRRIIYSVFLAIFLIATPLILLYTSGYRYNFNKGRVQKTGILILSTTPRKAQITLNGETLKNKTTPAEIKNVLPGDYEIVLQKDGYHPWSKKLPVYENSTTFAEKIILWKNSKPQELNQHFAKTWTASNDNQKAAFADENNNLYAFSLQDNSFTSLGQASGTVSSVSWSNSNKKIITSQKIGDKISYFIYDLNNPNQAARQITGYEKVSWPTNNDSYVYGLNAGQLWNISLSNNSKQAVTKNTAGDAYIDNSTLYSIRGRQIFKRDLNNFLILPLIVGEQKLIIISMY